MRLLISPVIQRLPPRLAPKRRPLRPVQALRPSRPLRSLRPLRCAPEPEGTPEEVEETSLRGLFFGGLYERGKDPRLFGDNVDPDLPLPTEYEQDFWENANFEFLAVMMQYFIPVLIVLGLLVGGIAAKSFNEGATSYLQPASEETNAEILPIQPKDAE